MDEPEIVKILDAARGFLREEHAVEDVDVLRNQAYLRGEIVLVDPLDLLLVSVDQLQMPEPRIQEFKDLPCYRGFTSDDFLPVSMVFVSDLLELFALSQSGDLNQLLVSRELYPAQLYVRVQELLSVRVLVEPGLLLIQVTE